MPGGALRNFLKTAVPSVPWPFFDVDDGVRRHGGGGSGTGDTESVAQEAWPCQEFVFKIM